MIETIVNSWLNKTKNELINNYNRLGLKASGNWAKVLEGTQEKTASNISIKFLGAQYTGALENGRQPTKTQTAGNPTLRQVIRKWIDVKGINPNGITKDSLAFLIARKIHKEGIKVPNKYNAGGLMTDVITTENINKLVKDLGFAKIKDFKSEIIKTFK